MAIVIVAGKKSYIKNIRNSGKNITKLIGKKTRKNYLKNAKPKEYYAGS